MKHSNAMRKIILLITMLLAISFIPSCQYIRLDDIFEPKKDGELLKIKTYVQREDAPEGYYEYADDHTRYQGHWLTKTGEKIHASEIYEEQELEVGKTMICAPLGYRGRQNLMITIEFDGYIDIECDPVEDDRIRLGHSVSEPLTESYLGMAIGRSFRARSPFNLGVCPIGRFISATGIVTPDTLVDCEYFINIYAYDINERPKAEARLRIKSIKDPDPNYKCDYEDEFSLYGPGEETTRFVEIELISCEYGDEIG